MVENRRQACGAREDHAIADVTRRRAADPVEIVVADRVADEIGPAPNIGCGEDVDRQRDFTIEGAVISQDGQAEWAGRQAGGDGHRAAPSVAGALCKVSDRPAISRQIHFHGLDRARAAGVDGRAHGNGRISDNISAAGGAGSNTARAAGRSDGGVLQDDTVAVGLDKPIPGIRDWPERHQTRA